MLGDGGGEPGEPVRSRDRRAGGRRLRAGGEAPGPDRFGGPSMGAANQLPGGSGLHQRPGAGSVPLRDRGAGPAGGPGEGAAVIAADPRRVFAAACLGMLLFGVTLTTLGAVLPPLIARYGLEKADAG